MIRDAGITLNLEKCDFGKPEVKLVGHIVGSGCRKADSERTQAMNDVRVFYLVAYVGLVW